MKRIVLGATAVILFFSALSFSAGSGNGNHETDQAGTVTTTAASRSIDTIGGTETMGENTEKITCSCCGKVLNASQKFCPECGTPLSRPSSAAVSASFDAGVAETDTNKNNGVNNGFFIGMGPGMSAGMGLSGTGGKPWVQPDVNAEPVNIYPDDSGLKLMVDCRDTTGPLAGGIVQSSEIVLYYDDKTDGYQVHTYASGGYGSRKHEGYTTTKEHADRVMQSIDADTVLKYKNLPVPVGGSRIMIFRNEKDETVRAECSTGVLSKMKGSVEGLLYEAVRAENRIVPEEAKNWKECVVSASGMSMDNCFNYELERMENGKVRVRGNCFVRGNHREHENWIELSKKEAAELEKIPLGLMLSDIVTNPDPMMAAGFAGIVLDGESLSVSITYADGKRDTKIPDREMIRDLDELMKRVF